MPVKNVENAFRIVTDIEYGLNATTFSLKILIKLSIWCVLFLVAKVSVNGFLKVISKPHLVGISNLGGLPRENSTQAIEQYLKTKIIWAETKSG